MRIENLIQHDLENEDCDSIYKEDLKHFESGGLDHSAIIAVFEKMIERRKKELAIIGGKGKSRQVFKLVLEIMLISKHIHNGDANA